MQKSIVIPPGTPPPLASYSPGVLADNILYVSGSLSMDKSGATFGVGDVRAQTRQVLESIRQVVEAAGGSMSSIVYNMIFLKDLADYAAMNDVYAEYFAVSPPARFCIQADLVRPEFLVEVASVAHL